MLIRQKKVQFYFISLTLLCLKTGLNQFKEVFQRQTPFVHTHHPGQSFACFETLR